jgi:hypothetical protein
MPLLRNCLDRRARGKGKTQTGMFDGNGLQDSEHQMLWNSACRRHPDV